MAKAEIVLGELSGGGGGDRKAYVVQAPTSNIINCGFQATKVYYSDPNYNTSHKIICIYDTEIDSANYVQRYDSSASIENNTGAYPFVTIGVTSVTIDSAYYNKMSANAVVAVIE